VRARIEPGLYYPATRYVEALSMRAAITDKWIASCMGNADLALLPAISIPVPTIAATTEGDPADIARVIGQLTHCTRGINYLGLPATSVPCGFDRAGLPIAFQLVGRPYSEATMLRAAHAYQGLTDWHQRMPAAAELN
jgi:aspartyl-tRNA(Asn)/glutamyl-tRNA(Gln) amidotransferase subunit A